MFRMVATSLKDVAAFSAANVSVEEEERLTGTLTRELHCSSCSSRSLTRDRHSSSHFLQMPRSMAKNLPMSRPKLPPNSIHSFVTDSSARLGHPRPFLTTTSRSGWL